MDVFHVFEQGDIVLTAVFVLLLAMSITSWYIIFWKGLKLRKERKLYRSFCAKYVTSPDWPRNDLPENAGGSVNALLEATRKITPVLANYNSEGRQKLMAG